jgi:folate-binding protein YgfZ
MALLLDEPAVVRRPAGVVRVSGPDRLSYLHTLLSQQLEDAAPGMVADFLYLDAKGNAQALGRALVLEDEVLLLTDAAVAPGFADALERFKFMLDVRSEDVSGEWALASVRGGDVPEVEGAPSDAMTLAADGDGLLVRDRSGGVDLLGPPRWVDERVAALATPEAPDAAWEAWRIAHGEPAWGREVTPGHRPQELGLLPTHVHLRKGCYPGQESIAKTWNLGRPRRALAVVELDAEPGETLTVGGKDAKVTSSAPVDGRWVALALLPVDRDGGLPDAIEAPPGRVLRRVGEGLAIPGA